MARNKLEKTMDEAFSPVTMTMEELEQLCENSKATEPADVSVEEWQEFLAFKAEKEKAAEEAIKKTKREEQFNSAQVLINFGIDQTISQKYERSSKVLDAIHNLTDKQKDIVWKKHLAGLIAGAKYNKKLVELSDRIRDLWKLHDQIHEEIKELQSRKLTYKSLECPHDYTWAFRYE